MKAVLSLIAFIFLSNILLAQTTAIPDANFEQALIDLGYDTGVPDGSVSTANIDTVTSLYLSWREISDLTGIEGFIALITLDCNGNHLIALDVSSCTSLAYLNCSWNQSLSTLDVSSCTSLTSLDCSGNNLSILDVSACTSLTTLNCETNTIDDLDFSGCISLTTLNCGRNYSSELDISSCTSLSTLSCWGNYLTILDVSACTSLITLDCYENRLTTLDVSACTSLNTLDCYGNRLTTLNVSACTSLTTLNCFENFYLTTLDVSACTSLITLDCYENRLTTLDVSACSLLTTLYCDNNNITILDVSACTSLSILSCWDNALITLDVSACTSLTTLSCGNNNIQTLDVSGFTSLATLDYNYNIHLDTLDVSGCTALTSLECYKENVGLVSLDALGCTALETMIFGNYRLTTMDVSACNSLTVLYYPGNSLTTLDVSNCTSLVTLYCPGNNLRALDVSNCTSLATLYCPESELTTLDVSSCTSLVTLYCDDSQLTTLDVSACNSLTTLDCSDNDLSSLDVRNGNNKNMEYVHIYGNPNLFCIAVDDAWYSTLNWRGSLYPYYKDDWAQYTSGPCGNNIISGYIYHDENKNCNRDSGEQFMTDVFVMSSDSSQLYFKTDNNGYYEYRADSNVNYHLSVQYSKYSNLLEAFCPDTGYIINSGPDGTETPDIDFGVQLKDCALLSVDVSKDRMRRCFLSNTTISYKNEGTIGQTNAEIFVDFPEYIKLISASESYTEVDAAEGIYKFVIDTIDAFSEGEITIIDSVICGNEDIRGYTQCIKTWITPKSYCAETKDTTQWDKSSIEVLDKAQCIGDSIVRFTILNHGSGDMLAAHEYRLYYNNQLAYTGSFQLVSNDDLVIDVTADGSTIRLEADQHPLHPGNSRPRATIEGCGTYVPLDASLGFWPQAANDDLDIDISEECMMIRDSYDPNDKKVSPEGVSDNHYVPEKEPLKYTIRFQNTGNDMAYKIIVVDTLSNQLDLSTLNINGASHDFEYEVMGEDVVVLVFTFNNIYLPDSISNEPGSHGYVSFSISPVDSIISGTRIENYADIYFDYNSEIRTDTAFVIALDTVITSSSEIKVIEVETTLEDRSIVICPDFIGVNGDSVDVVSYLNGPINGTISSTNDGDTCFVYTPEANFNGNDHVDIVVCDSGGDCDTINIVIAVSPVDDPLVVNDDTATTPEDHPITICPVVNYFDGTNPDVSSYLNGPVNGTISGINDGDTCFIYTPDANYNGNDTLEIVVCDVGGACDTASIIIIVSPVNDPPIVNDDTATTPEDHPITICPTVSDVDGSNLDVVSCLNGSTNGTLSGINDGDTCFIYTPDTNYFGNDTLEIVVCDVGGACDTASIIIIVSPVNDPPIVNDDTATTPEDHPITICPTVSDADGSNLDVVSCLNGPTNGTLSGINDGDTCFTYTPDTNYFGKDTFDIVVCDSIGACDTANIIVTVVFDNGIAENELPNISIYPNPSNNYLIIKGADVEFNQLKIYDVMGRLLVSKTITANQQKVDVQSLTQGTYFIHLVNYEGEKYIYKIVKK